MVQGIIMGILCFSSILFGMVCFLKLIGVKQQIVYMTETLNDIQLGNSNQKILTTDNQLTSNLSFKINEIIYGYEERFSQFREADEMNRQLMTSLSHDVRTPLTTLIGYLDAIHRGVVKGIEREEYFEVARGKAYKLKDYIDGLFDWFKLNSSEFSLVLKETEIAELTRNILKDWIPVFDEKKVNYEIDIPNQPLLTRLDSDGYARIINNLVQNVVNHSQATQIKIDMLNQDNEILIRIMDNGIGIEKSDLLHIFERLYTCDKGRSNTGSGLGLAIVSQMVQKMGAHIMVQSEINQYTVFTVSFPLVD